VGTDPLAVNGSATVTPSATTTYTITATGAGGTATATATVMVGPTVSLTASPTTVFNGGTATLTWTSTNATSVSIAPAVGTDPLPVNGSAAATPAATTVYTITATDGQLTATATATVTVLPQGAAQTTIHHLIVVILQNHSFDNLFGTFPNANGLDPNAPSYHQIDAKGNTVSPSLLNTLNTPDLNHDRTTYTKAWHNGAMDKYAATNGDLSMKYADNTVFGTATDGKSYGVKTLWDYAQQFVLADNFFASAMNNEPANMLYMLAATVHDDHTGGSLPYYDKCTPVDLKRDPSSSKAAPLAEQNIGDQMNQAGVKWVWYQGGYSHSIDGTCNNYVPQENAFQYFTTTANSANVQDFSFNTYQTLLADDNALPAVSFITPSSGVSMHPGSGDAANGIEWLDQLLQMVENSPVWSDTAVIVLWDESGGWYDHVPPPQIANTQGLGARVPVFVVSPFAKQAVISHQQMDFVSITRFIQWNWGLGMFNDPAHPEQAAREQQSADICDLLTISPCAGP
jgi:phospholipase C